LRNVYLDYSATTPVKEEVLAEMLPYFRENFGNPSSLYSLAFVSKDGIAQARKNLANLIGAKENEVYFTSGGTEADNWAVIGTARAKKNKGNHIITSKIEHHALLHSCEFLEKEGFDVTYLEVDEKGLVSVTELADAIREDTILVSIMLANNEVGTIQPIKEISEITKKKGILLHTDAVQALGNVPIDVNDLGVDLMSVSGHKIYGPKGIGALYIRSGVVISNFMFGGGQESKKRAGTENLPGIIGFGKAAELAGKNLSQHIEQLTSLRNYFIKEIIDKIEGVTLNGDPVKRLPGNANLTFDYVEGEAVLLYLDIMGIAISTGSACSSASFAPSHVLTAMGIPIEQVYSSLRFTIGDFTTKEDLDYVVEKLVEVIAKYRALSPFGKENQMKTTQSCACQGYECSGCDCVKKEGRE